MMINADKFIDTGMGLIIHPPVSKGLDVEDVHVATPEMQKPENEKKKKKEKKDKAKPEVQKNVELFKLDEDQRLVYGVVLVPDIEDLQGDVISKEEIQAAAHDYQVKSRIIKAQHRAPTDAEVVESYIAPVDIPIGNGTAPSGSWIMVTRINSASMWEAIKKGEITGYSIGGVGEREEM